ncbi:MAG: hypothetical protein QOD06_2352 [Candidatus Binatota bacterium]|jgi:hypothetical protein|nr:hypothetical protein [Candidatus Binatota bacterium]
MRRLVLCLVFISSVACAQDKKQAWRESGQSWKESGKQFLRALGNSIKGEPEKEEWKEVGTDAGDAGKDTAEAIGTSIQPSRDGGGHSSADAGPQPPEDASQPTPEPR